MARTNATNFTGPLQFPYANAGTDIFKKEDVQTLAQAVDQHDHTTGKGLPMAAGSIPNGTITSAMIADGTIQGADIATGTITTTQIADGTIATADLANAAVTNAKLGTDTARLNLLTNGGFEIWQRGNGPFTAQFAYTADCWSIQLGGSSTVSVSRITSTAGSNGFSASVTYAHSAGGYLIFNSQKFDSPAQLAGRAVSAAVMVKASVAGTVKLRITDGVGNSDSTYNVGTGAERLTVTRTVVTNPTSIQVLVICDIGSSSVELNDAMLVVGSVAADYAPLHPADDLARCLRYYEVVGESAGTFQVTTYASAGGQLPTFTLPYRARKPVLPTITKVGTWNVVNCSQPVVNGIGIDLCCMQATSTAAGLINYTNQNAGNAVTVEANP